MQDYNKMKANPDPAIAKYTKKPAVAPEKVTEISNTQKPFDLPDLKEIPEIRQSDPVMEIL